VSTPRLSVIVPVLNDAPALELLLTELDATLTPAEAEVLVVDGGSVDHPEAILIPPARLLSAPRPGRGGQLALGARAARGEWLWLLHADSRNTAAAASFLRTLDCPGWGRFDVSLQIDSEPPGSALRLIAWMMNWRSRLTGICTGDQGIFIHRLLLERVGGVPAQPLMEDIELSRRLKRICAPICPRVCLNSSARRWRKQGLFRTIIHMWTFRLRYWLGADPRQLTREYYQDD